MLNGRALRPEIASASTFRLRVLRCDRLVRVSQTNRRRTRRPARMATAWRVSAVTRGRWRKNSRRVPQSVRQTSSAVVPQRTSQTACNSTRRRACGWSGRDEFVTDMSRRGTSGQRCDRRCGVRGDAVYGSQVERHDPSFYNGSLHSLTVFRADVSR